MSRKYFKQYLPDPQSIRENRYLRVFGKLLLDPNLWHLNRRTASSAFAIGLFCAFIPVPFQMVISAGFAILFRVNIPISVATVWISNPITMPPLFYFAYWVGTLVLGVEIGSFDFELSVAWLSSGLLSIWKPFLLGCFLVGVVSSIVGYISVRLLWRLHIISLIKEKHSRRRQRKNKS